MSKIFNARKKPIIITAYEIDNPNGEDISTLEGTMHGNCGDFVITGVAGEKYPCNREIFLASYDIMDGAL